jgi:hypothetical protein
MKNIIANSFLILSLLSFSSSFCQSKTETYIPTKNRFHNFDESRTLLINNKPLTLNQFEMFDIMTFQEVGTGFFEYLMFTIPETGEEFNFNDTYNQFTYNGAFNNQYLWTGNQATLTLKCINENLVRVLKKNSKYKVIYCYINESELDRKPFGTESYSGYYIVDVIEIFDQFEREKDLDY